MKYKCDIVLRKNIGITAGKQKEMRWIPELDTYAIAAILLIAAAITLVEAALVTNLGEFVTAAFVVSGTSCALIGIFILTFSRRDRGDARLVGMLNAQWCKNICRIESDLGITGNAYFLPPRITGEFRVMQFTPTLTYSGNMISAREPFIRAGTPGIIVTPCSDPWIQDLKNRTALRIPDNAEDLIVLISETVGDVFEFASRVSGKSRDNTIELVFHDFLFIEGCKSIARESEELCTMSPCPICCLCGSLIAEGTERAVTLDQCSVKPTSRDVTMVFSIMPFPKVLTDQAPSGTGSGSSVDAIASGPSEQKKIP